MHVSDYVLFLRSGVGQRDIPVSENDGSIISCLLEGVVTYPICFIVSWTSSQDSKLLIHIPIDERKKGERWKQNIRNERCHHCGEGCSDAVVKYQYVEVTARMLT